MKQTVNFTKTYIQELSPVESKRLYVYDEKVPGLVLSVTPNGCKSFLVYKKVQGKPQRITLGRFPNLTIEQARKEAQKIIGLVATGHNPIAEKKEQQARALTLLEVFEDYLGARRNLKPSTVKDYRRALREVFLDWQDKHLIKITKDMVSKRHETFGANHSRARANTAMRVLRAIFNFAAGEYEDAKGKALFPENPVIRLSHLRAWYRIERRQSVIKTHELPVWFKSVMELGEDRHNSKARTVRDYLLLILFTGLRRTEAAHLSWKQIDFQAKSLMITETKNHRVHVLPLSNFLFDLLLERRTMIHSDFVFPGEGSTGYFAEPRKQMKKIIDATGIDFTLHDLRRTFITIAESLDIPAYALKKLLNHRMEHDVTAGYIIIDVERLRKPMQMIADYLLTVVGYKAGAKIVNIITQGVAI